MDFKTASMVIFNRILHFIYDYNCMLRYMGNCMIKIYNLFDKHILNIFVLIIILYNFYIFIFKDLDKLF